MYFWPINKQNYPKCQAFLINLIKSNEQFVQYFPLPTWVASPQNRKKPSENLDLELAKCVGFQLWLDAVLRHSLRQVLHHVRRVHARPFVQVRRTWRQARHIRSKRTVQVQALGTFFKFPKIPAAGGDT